MPRVVERPHVSDRSSRHAKVYVETTIVSYLTARPSRDLVVASHQQIMHEWWTCERQRFDLCVSEFVLAEARAGTDAQHVAMAAAHGMDYLLTWNCRHIANAAARRRLEAACRTMGYALPTLCNPEELMR